MMRFTALVLAVATLGGCRGHRSDTGGAAASGAKVAAPAPVSSPDAAPGGADVRAILARLDLAARRKALQGAWVVVDADVSNSNTRPLAVGIAPDGTVQTWNGRTGTTWRLGNNSACEVLFARPPSTDEGVIFTYVVHDGVAELGNGDAGERVGKGAILCTGAGMYVLDDAGRCAVVISDVAFSEPARCGWRTSGGRDVFFYEEPVRHEEVERPVAGWKIGGLANGPDAAPWEGRYPDFAAARALVEREADAKDPLRIALAAGGKVGDPSTVAGLVATFTSDPESLRGHVVQVRGVILGRWPWGGTDGSGEALRLADPVRRDGLWIGCRVQGAAGASDGAAVTVEGRVDDGDMDATWTDRVAGIPGLRDCHVR